MESSSELKALALDALSHSPADRHCCIRHILSLRQHQLHIGRI